MCVCRCRAPAGDTQGGQSQVRGRARLHAAHTTEDRANKAGPGRSFISALSCGGGGGRSGGEGEGEGEGGWWLVGSGNLFTAAAVSDGRDTHESQFVGRR